MQPTAISPNKTYRWHLVKKACLGNRSIQQESLLFVSNLCKIEPQMPHPYLTLQIAQEEISQRSQIGKKNYKAQYYDRCFSPGHITLERSL